MRIYGRYFVPRTKSGLVEWMITNIGWQRRATMKLSKKALYRKLYDYMEYR